MSRRPDLTRDTQNKKVAGVCSGLARYFDIDPVIVRVLFVVFFFVGGGSILAYLILWLVLGDEPNPTTAPTSESTLESESTTEVITPEPAAT